VMLLLVFDGVRCTVLLFRSGHIPAKES
jgi:hypothetical protein